MTVTTVQTTVETTVKEPIIEIYTFVLWGDFVIALVRNAKHYYRLELYCKPAHFSFEYTDRAQLGTCIAYKIIGHSQRDMPFEVYAWLDQFTGEREELFQLTLKEKSELSVQINEAIKILHKVKVASR